MGLALVATAVLLDSSAHASPVHHSHVHHFHHPSETKHGHTSARVAHKAASHSEPSAISPGNKLFPLVIVAIVVGLFLVIGSLAFAVRFALTRRKPSVGKYADEKIVICAPASSSTDSLEETKALPVHPRRPLTSSVARGSQVRFNSGTAPSHSSPMYFLDTDSATALADNDLAPIPEKLSRPSSPQTSCYDYYTYDDLDNAPSDPVDAQHAWRIHVLDEASGEADASMEGPKPSFLPRN
ncbi:hypothetical protein MSPP1_000881 [Malassezia sp. CBS 17886]|nr:hypothetical protein MSPP1_000881 [Malassezia sp. CBS 17886]